MTVLVFEYVSGGGMVGRDLPPSWAAEGAAMRRAIASDFAAVPGVRAVATVDARLAGEAPPTGVEVRSISRHDDDWLRSLLSEVDCTVLIAPEAESTLAHWAEAIAQFGRRQLGSSERGVELTADKFRLARHFEEHQVPTPPTWTLETRLFELPGEWAGPVIVKPRFGAGSVDTIVVRDRRCPPWASPRREFVAQPFRAGVPMSASFLVDSRGERTLLGVGRQQVEVDGDGRVSYRGGVIDPRSQDCPAVIDLAVKSVLMAEGIAALRGFVGVDFLLDDRDKVTILEINPRPTTSYVGLARLFSPGTIAGAWLAAAEGPLAGTEWPNRLRLDPNTPGVEFDADGTTRIRTRDDER